MMSPLQRRADDSACPFFWRGLNAQALKTLHVAGLDTTLRIETSR
jgi:hypothetical protein